MIEQVETPAIELPNLTLHSRHPELRQEARVSLSLCRAVQRIPNYDLLALVHIGNHQLNHISQSALPFPLCYSVIHFGSPRSDSQATLRRTTSFTAAYEPRQKDWSYTRVHEHNYGCYQRWCRRRHKGTMRAFRVICFIRSRSVGRIGLTIIGLEAVEREPAAPVADMVL